MRREATGGGGRARGIPASRVSRSTPVRGGRSSHRRQEPGHSNHRTVPAEGARVGHHPSGGGVSKPELMRVILRQPSPDHVPEELRLTPLSRLVLLAIIEHCIQDDVVSRSRISKRALARAAGIDRSIVFSRHVPELVEAGYVVREPSDEDGFGGFSLVLSTFNRLHAIIQSRAGDPLDS